MRLELYLQNSSSGTVYNISNLAQEITVKDTLDGDAGTLECILQKDPNNVLQISNGSIISFIVDGIGFFYGYVFTIGTDGNMNYKIKCYNQMRYLKNSDIYTTSNLTASDIFAKICEDKNLKYNIKIPTSYIPTAYVHDNKTLYNIIKRGIDLASIYDNARYYITDRFGILTWSELSKEKTNVQLGDGFITDFKYEKSIDSNVYNQVKMYRDNESTGKRDVWIVKDSNNIKKWGLLQYLKKADDDANASQVKQSAENYLKIYNAEKETLSLSSDGILELTAGRGINFILKRENINKWMWIKSSTHKFTKDTHIMELEVEV